MYGEDRRDAIRRETANAFLFRAKHEYIARKERHNGSERPSAAYVCLCYERKVVGNMVGQEMLREDLLLPRFCVNDPPNPVEGQICGGFEDVRRIKAGLLANHDSLQPFNGAYLEAYSVETGFTRAPFRETVTFLALPVFAASISWRSNQRGRNVKIGNPLGPPGYHGHATREILQRTQSTGMPPD